MSSVPIIYKLHGLVIAPFDGETGEVGEVFFSNDDWHTPMITQYDPPMVVPAGQGFEWTCEWNNTTDNEVVYGNESTDEMCNMAVVFRPVEGMISMSAACEVVECPSCSVRVHADCWGEGGGRCPSCRQSSSPLPV